MLKGALAAAVTPLRDDGEALDEDAFAPYVEFLRAGGLDGILALGTTGEGILLSPDERKRAAELFVDAAGDRFDVAVHCGAQTTAETVALAGARGRDRCGRGRRDRAAVLPARRASARSSTSPRPPSACAPLPFYLYEFQRASGYAVPLAAIERLRELAPNLAGLKVSDPPFEDVEPYLIEGLDVFVGAESLVVRGLERRRGRAPSRGLRPSSRSSWPRLVRDRDGRRRASCGRRSSASRSRRR